MLLAWVLGLPALPAILYGPGESWGEPVSMGVGNCGLPESRGLRSLSSPCGQQVLRQASVASNGPEPAEVTDPAHA